MKLLGQMNRVVRISIIAVVLCFAMVGGSLFYKNGTAHACGNSIISASTTKVNHFSQEGAFVTITFSLWYNSCNQQNFTSANITPGSMSKLVVFVSRNAGPDGGSILAFSSSCPARGVCNSPGVYSPHNTAYGSISLDTPDLIYTASF